MSFQGKYQQLSALSDGESQTFRAVQVSTGRQVLIHQLTAGKVPPQQPDLASLIFKFLRSASEEDSRKLLDMGDEDGRVFVVTADVPACLDLRQWLLAATDPQPGKPAEPPPAEKTPSLEDIGATRGYTTEAMKEALRSAQKPPAPAAPAPKGPSGSGDIGATSAYTKEAMREALRSAEKLIAPAAPPAKSPSSSGNIAATSAFTKEAMREALRDAKKLVAPEAPSPKSPSGSGDIGATSAFTKEAMREALRDAKKLVAPEAPSPKSPSGSGDIGATSAFTKEAMREALRDAEKLAAPAPPSPKSPSGSGDIGATSAYTKEAMREALRDAKKLVAPEAPAPKSPSSSGDIGATSAYTKEAMREALRDAGKLIPPAAVPPAKSPSSSGDIGATSAYTKEAMREALRDAGKLIPPAASTTKSPASAGDIGATSAYTKEAMREALRDAGKLAAPTVPPPRPNFAPEIQAASPAAPPAFPVQSPPPEPPAVPPPTGESVPSGFTAFWQQSSAQSPAAGQESNAVPPDPPKEPLSPPTPGRGVTAEFNSYWSSRESLGIQDSPTSAMPALNSLDAARLRPQEPKPVPAPPPTASKESPVHFADVVLRPPEPVRPPVIPKAPQASKPQTPAPAQPSVNIPDTIVIPNLAEYLAKNEVAPRQPGVQGSQPQRGGNRRTMPEGFSVVAQSNKPRTGRTPTGLSQPPSAAAQPPVAPPAPLQKPLPKPVVSAAPSPVTPPIGDAALGRLASGPSQAPGSRKDAVGPANPPASSQPPTGGKAAKGPDESVDFGQKSTVKLVPEPAPPPAKKGNPGEYTRMIKNVKSLGGPLPPVGPLGDSGAGPLAVGVPSPGGQGSTPAPHPSSYQEASTQFQPLPYVASETPLPMPGRKRKNWVPILILSSLFIATVGLLLFYAFKH